MNFTSDAQLKQMIDEAITHNVKVIEIGDRVTRLEKKVGTLSEEGHQLGLKVEHMDQKLDTVLEVLISMAKKLENADQISTRQIEFESRLTIVEGSLKDHLANKEIHLK